MPELPEVETIVKELNQVVAGKHILGCEVLRETILQGTRPAFEAGIAGKKIVTIRRRGKYLLFHLFPKSVMIVHLRMTGKFVWLNPTSTHHPHDRLIFFLDEDKHLVYNDMRCFGTFELLESWELHPTLRSLGIEPFSQAFTPRYLKQLVQSRKTNIKNFLLDQRNIAGLGNIYVAEILFNAGIHPLKNTAELSEKTIEKLYRSLVKILNKAIVHNGTSIANYQRVDSKSGEFQHFLKVYGKANQPCQKCGRPIQRIKQNQRSTFFCQYCQR